MTLTLCSFGGNAPQLRALCPEGPGQARGGRRSRRTKRLFSAPGKPPADSLRLREALGVSRGSAFPAPALPLAAQLRTSCLIPTAERKAPKAHRLTPGVALGPHALRVLPTSRGPDGVPWLFHLRGVGTHLLSRREGERAGDHPCPRGGQRGPEGPGRSLLAGPRPARALAR